MRWEVGDLIKFKSSFSPEPDYGIVVKRVKKNVHLMYWILSNRLSETEDGEIYPKVMTNLSRQ